MFALVLLCFLPGLHAQFDQSIRTQGPARSTVFVVENPLATEAFRPRPDQMEPMLVQGLTRLTQTATIRDAWLSLVRTNDVVGIKVFSEPGPNSGTRQSVVAAVVQSLIAAGIPTNNIIVWDKRLGDLKLAGFNRLSEQLGIRLVGSAEAGFDEKTYYESSLIGTLVWGDLEFGRKGEGVGKRSFVSKLVSRDITKIINITPLMNHNQVGVVGNLYSLALGSVDNSRRFENDPARLATAVPEIYALPALSDKVVLNIVDALICQYEGEERTLLHYSTPLNQLRFSKDPVALDALSLQELEQQREKSKAPRLKTNMELYSNAELLELGISNPGKIRVVKVTQ
jgi:hypothetical protein